MSPNLFIVGFQKCGSSSLFDFLIQHPDIIGCQPKETFALTDFDYEHFDEEKSVLFEHFDWKDYYQENAHKKIYRLEASVCNFYQETALKYISNISGAKVIFILRDPIDRFVSTYNYFGGNGLFLEPGIKIEEYLKLSQQRAHPYEAMNFSLEHGKYGDFLPRWQNRIEQKNLLIIGLRPLVTDTDEIAKRIWNFLDLQPYPGIKLRHENSSQILRFKNLNRFLVRHFGGLNLGNTTLAQVYRRLNTSTKSKKIQISAPLKDFLIEYYTEEYRIYKQYF